MITDEQKAEIDAKLDAILNKRRPVPPSKPTPEQVWAERQALLPEERREVAVNSVRINMAEYERQRFEREAVEAREQQFRQSLSTSDPMGIWTKDGDR